MRIQGPKTPLVDDKLPRPTARPSGGEQVDAPADSVRISDSSKVVLGRVMDDGERERKIERLRVQVADGHYEIDFDKLAARIFEDEAARSER